MTYKSGGVVVPDGLGVAEGFQDGVGHDQQVLDTLQLAHVGVDAGYVAHDHFGVLRLSRTTLTWEICDMVWSQENDNRN